MSSLPPAPPPPGKKKRENEPQPGGPKRRSPVERVVVWTLIAALLGLLGWEWNSQRGYTATIAALRPGVGEKNVEIPEMTFAQAEPLLKGNFRRSETQERNGRIIQLRWPSLFKKYQVRLRVDEADVISDMFTGDQDE